MGHLKSSSLLVGLLLALALPIQATVIVNNDIGFGALFFEIDGPQSVDLMQGLNATVSTLAQASNSLGQSQVSFGSPAFGSETAIASVDYASAAVMANAEPTWRTFLNSSTQILSLGSDIDVSSNLNLPFQSVAVQPGSTFAQVAISGNLEIDDPIQSEVTLDVLTTCSGQGFMRNSYAISSNSLITAGFTLAGSAVINQDHTFPVNSQNSLGITGATRILACPLFSIGDIGSITVPTNVPLPFEFDVRAEASGAAIPAPEPSTFSLAVCGLLAASCFVFKKTLRRQIGYPADARSTEAVSIQTIPQVPPSRRP